MNYRSLWIVLLAVMVSLTPLAASLSGDVLAAEEPAKEAAAAESEDMMTEAELGDLLVNMLGLNIYLPPNPQQTDVFAILMQNGIMPKEGWQPDNLVTFGNLARILVQARGDADKIENPDDDAAWVDYLKSIGVDFGTIEEGLATAAPVADPVAIVALDPSTDPLRKVPSIRPSDEQQLGADLQPYNSQLTADDIRRFILETQPADPGGERPAGTPN